MEKLFCFVKLFTVDFIKLYLQYGSSWSASGTGLGAAASSAAWPPLLEVSSLSVSDTGRRHGNTYNTMHTELDLEYIQYNTY